MLDKNNISLQSDKENSQPFLYHLIFEIHHGIADGFTNLKVCDLLIQIINSIIMGNFIDDNKQIGEITPPENSLEKWKEKEKSLNESDDDSLAKYENNFSDNIHNFDVFPLDTKAISKTCWRSIVLNRNQTAKLSQMCKEAGVTVNSTLSAIINITIAYVLKTDRNILGAHAVNLRRYMDQNDKCNLGNCIAVCLLSKNVPKSKETSHKFWEYAKEIHNDIHPSIKNGDFIKQDILREISIKKQKRSFRRFYFPKKPFFHYFMTNMGSVDTIFSGVNENIQVQNISRISSIHKICHPLTYTIQSFRKKLTCNLVYNTTYLDSERAQKLANAFETIIMEIINPHQSSSFSCKCYKSPSIHAIPFFQNTPVL